MTKLFTVIAPKSDNDGNSNMPTIALIKAEIAALTGGLSYHDQYGAWYDEDGREYLDESIALSTVCSEEQCSALLARASTWRVWLRQIELLCMVGSVEVSFVGAAIEVA